MVNSEDLFKKHLCDNSTVLFNIGLEYLGIQTNIKVTHYNFVTLAETLLTLGVDYTVDTTNNTITTTSTYPGNGVAGTSDLLTITYAVPSTQKTDITANSNYDPEVLEEAYDHGVLLSKEVKEIAERAIRTAISDAGTVLPLPTISSGLEKYLWLNASGEFEWKTGTIPDSSTISAEDIPIVDTGSHYTGADVEVALQEAGALDALDLTHRTGNGADHANIALNDTHRASDGTDHDYLDQDVKAAADPTFNSLTISNGITFPAFGEIGSIVIAGSTAWTVSTEYLPGTTVSGSSMRYSSATAAGGNVTALSGESSSELRVLTGTSQNPGLSGTWRLLSRIYMGSDSTIIPIAMFQRIA